jgi:hypothetical protein
MFNLIGLMLESINLCPAIPNRIEVAGCHCVKQRQDLSSAQHGNIHMLLHGFNG